MKPFKHINVKTIEEAVSTGYEHVLFIAGGTDCLSILKNRVLSTYPEVLVNIKTISGLEYIHEDDEGLTIGALTKLVDIADSPLIESTYGMLADAAKTVASPQIRNMGTLGGNLCQDTRCWYYRCSPFTGRSYSCLRKGGRECFAVAGDNRYHAILGGKGCFAVCPSDTAIALSALEATVAVAGQSGKRMIPVRDFFTTLGNVLRSHEIITEVRIPRPPPGAKQTFLKFRLRKALDFAVVSVASVISIEQEVCREARIVLGAVAPTPIRAVRAEDAIRGAAVNAETAEAAAEAALTGATPLAMNAYKVAIAKALVKRALIKNRPTSSGNRY